MLGRLNIKHKICQFFQFIWRISDTTLDIPQRCILTWEWLELCSVPGRQLWCQSAARWVSSCAVAFCWELNMSKELTGFGSSLVLVKLGSGIKPPSPESKDNDGPGGQQVSAPPVCCWSYSAKQGGLHSVAKIFISAAPQRAEVGLWVLLLLSSE